MNKKVVTILLGGLCLMVCFSLYKIIRQPEVKFVRSADLVYGFIGMKEAQKEQEKITQELKARLDTLQLDFQRSVSRYNMDFSKLSLKERKERERVLSLQQDNLRNYSQKVQDEIKQKDLKLTEGVLNQVNSFVEEYAKSNGYDLVLGTTASGNILYAKDYMDITDEVLKALNEDFKKPANANQ